MAERATNASHRSDLSALTHAPLIAVSGERNHVGRVPKSEMIGPQESSSLHLLPRSPTAIPRMSLLIMNLAHSNEIYGNIVTTMRMKSIVPPSSEPRPPQPRQQ
jgi:hypothetical protein